MNKWKKQLLWVNDAVTSPLESSMRETEGNLLIVWINQSEDVSKFFCGILQLVLVHETFPCNLTGCLFMPSV